MDPTSTKKIEIVLTVKIVCIGDPTNERTNNVSIYHQEYQEGNQAR